MFAGIHAWTGVPVAVKYIEKKKVTSWDNLDGQRVPLELKLLQQVQRVKGVIRFLDFNEEKDYFVMIMERPFWCKDLFEIISEQDGLDEDLACDYFKQIVETVIDCQKHGVIHGDIKAENIIIDLLSNKTKLVDFGSGSYIQEDFSTKFEGTPILFYFPPPSVNSRYPCFFSSRMDLVWPVSRCSSNGMVPWYLALYHGLRVCAVGRGQRHHQC